MSYSEILGELTSEELLEGVRTGGIDPNSVDPQNETPLLAAMSLESVELVEGILEAGADPNLKTPEGDFPLQRALHYALHGEIGYRYLDVLLAHGGNLNIHFIPPLHGACQSGDLRLVRYLLDHGADPSCYDGDDNLPEDWAIRADIPEGMKLATLRALAEHATKPDETDA